MSKCYRTLNITSDVGCLVIEQVFHDQWQFVPIDTQPADDGTTDIHIMEKVSPQILNDMQVAVRTMVSYRKRI